MSLDNILAQSRIAVTAFSWFVSVGAFALCGSLNAADPAKKPNVVLILADDLGFSDLGCYGSEIRTPNLDALAANGLRFTQFYNTARCWPSRAALMTGYYPQQVRRDVVPGVVSGNGGKRPAWAKLLPELLKPAGYRSYHSGKWHIDGPRLAAGFDRSYSLEDHDRYFQPRNHLLDDKKLPPLEESGHYVTTEITDHALEFLKEHRASHADSPFFVYLAYTAPHFPLQASAADIARYRTAYREGWEASRAARLERLSKNGIFTGKPAAVERELGPPYAFPKAIEKLGLGESTLPKLWSELSEVQREFQSAKMAIHAAMIDRMDQEIGRVVESLRASGNLENTLIMFMSDNGASAEIMIRGDGHDPQASPGSAETFLCLGPGWSSVANTPFRRHKTWVHEGGIATPLIMHWPAAIKAKGELRTTPAHLIDVVPTILSVAHIGANEVESKAPPRPGKNLMPVFSKDQETFHDSLWWSHEGNRALRVGDLKIVANKNKPWELYDLKQDRAESYDLAGTRQDTVVQMAERWEKLNDRFTAEAKADMPAKPSK